VLELVDRLGVEEVELALTPPLVLAADLEGAVRPLGGVRGERQEVPAGDLFGDLVEADATEAADGAGEVLVDEGGREADCLEDLGPV